jgi:cell division protein FtsB
VIAPERFEADYDAAERARPRRTPQELRRIDRARHATKRRARHKRRRMHRPVLAVVTLAFAILIPLLAYVTLTANLTSLSFALTGAERERTALATETQRLDDKIAGLQSPERLAALAGKLKLHDPHIYAVVPIPEPRAAQPRPSGLAFLGTWLSGTSR